MSTFTPPTETYARTSPRAHPLANRLAAHGSPCVRGRNVYYLSDGTATETDPDGVTVKWSNDGAGTTYVVQAWWGSTESPYTVTAAQAAALTTAGFTVT